MGLVPWLGLAALVFLRGAGADEFFLHCNNRGQLDLATHTCSCISGYTGSDCSQKLCPVGRAWVDYPTATDTAHAKYTECSGFGYCNPKTGFCQCRSGFEGPACERMSCPTTTEQPCSGHGRCMTMHQAAKRWDGYHLTRPHVRYTEPWDAHKIQGCLCDMGFTGYDCSLKECPRGDDPMTTGQQNEVMMLECQADGGSFFFQFRGQRTDAIPYDAGYGTVERLIEKLLSVKDVTVTFGNYSMPVCGYEQKQTTYIEFIQDFGSLPAARVDATYLTSTYRGSPWLYMVTRHVLNCPAGGDFLRGWFFLSYDGKVTNRLSYDASEAQVTAALQDLPTVKAQSDYGNITVSVNISRYAVCLVDTPSNTTIYFRSKYGNLYDLELINSVRYTDPKITNASSHNMTYSSNKGTKENLVCSDHGECDYATGTCKCAIARSTNYEYYWGSSDGYGKQGARGDCGHRFGPGGFPKTCPGDIGGGVEPVLCSGHGRCNNATMACECFDTYFGSACNQRYCPTGNAWFDEASADDEAHTTILECSGRGVCNHYTGTCSCDSNFIGSACEYLGCEYDNARDPCNGHGRCLPMWQLAEVGDMNGDETGFTYGSADKNSNSPLTWDRNMMWGCHCDTKDQRQPYAGPKDYISGVYVDNPQILGWNGYDCSRKWCPTGDDPRSDGVYEKQAIACTDESNNFTISFRRQTTRQLNPNSTVTQVAKALMDLTTIGFVNVTFTNSSKACNSTYTNGTGIEVFFLTELGDVPLMKTVPKYNVSEVLKGTKEDVECSNRGYCDYETGHCQCIRGYSSSAGNNSIGNRRDCGREDPFSITLNKYTGP